MDTSSQSFAWELAEIERQLQVSSILDVREYARLRALTHSRDNDLRTRAQAALQKAA